MQTYDIRCELFEYSSEQLDTGYSEIDDIEDNLSLDTTKFEFTLEAGGGYGSGVILGEDGDSIIQEFSLNTMDAQANNALFRSDILSDDIIDFSERDPWSEGRF